MPRKAKLSVKEIAILLKDFNFFNTSGTFRPLTDKVWQEASDLMDGQMNKKYVYLYITKNRNAFLKDILTKEAFVKFEYNLKAKQTPRKRSDVSNWSMDAHANMPHLRENLVIPTELWKKIQPQTRLYKNREYNVLQPGWADVIFALLWDKFKLPCSFNFKNGKVSTTPGEHYFRIHGECKECGNAVNLYNLTGPDEDGLHVHVSTYDSRDIAHNNKRQMKGVERKNIVEQLKGTSTYNWRREKANSVMQFGDIEPAHLYSENVLRKAKQLDQDAELGVKGLTDPIKSLIDLKYGLEFTGCLREIGIDRFFVMYWSPEQTFVYNKLAKSDRIRKISIDATGSLVSALVKPDGSKHAIFIYQAVTAVDNKILPIFQMVSEKHDTNMLSYWMREWLRCGVICPRQIVTDYSLALLNAAALAFNNIDLGSYVEQCIGTLTTGCTAPVCILRIDIAHLIKLVCRWKCFKRTPQSVKDFFVRCVGLLSHCGTIDYFSTICKDVLTVAFSKTEDVNNSSDKCFAAQQSILKKIKSIECPSETPNDNNFCPLKEDEEDCTKTGSRIQSLLEKLEFESRETSSGDRPNPYFCEEFGKNLLRISRHFVLWTNVMSVEVASSACSEEYFRELKRFVTKGVKSIRVDKFLIMHLRSISGTVKLLNAPITKATSDKDLLKIAKESDSHSVEPFSSTIGLEESVPATATSISSEKVSLLNEVETWRGLNPPPTKRGKYLTPCPDIEKIYQRPIFDRAMPVLQNGSSLPPLKVGQQILQIVNTCPFDSIVQSLLTAYRDWSGYHNYVTESVNATFDLVKRLSLYGITHKIYAQRAEILSTIVKPKNGRLDCANNISSLVSRHILKNEPSFERKEVCASSCGHDERNIFPVLELSSLPFYANGMRALQSAVDEFCELPKKICKRCKSDLIINCFNGSHIFIDIECLEWPELAARLGFSPRTMKFTISEIPIDLKVCNVDYKLVAAIIYSGGSTDHESSIGHYYPFIRRITGKWEIQNDLNSNRKPLLASARKLLQKQRVHMLFYVKGQ